MKICVFGAGAIGGYIGCSLSKAGANVSLIARGPHKEAIEENGLTLITGNRSENFNLKVTENPEELETQDYIIIGVKAHAIAGIVENLKPLLIKIRQFYLQLTEYLGGIFTKQTQIQF